MRCILGAEIDDDHCCQLGLAVLGGDWRSGNLDNFVDLLGGRQRSLELDAMVPGERLEAEAGP